MNAKGGLQESAGCKWIARSAVEGGFCHPELKVRGKFEGDPSTAEERQASQRVSVLSDRWSRRTAKRRAQELLLGYLSDEGLKSDVA